MRLPVVGYVDRSREGRLLAMRLAEPRRNERSLDGTAREPPRAIEENAWFSCSLRIDRSRDHFVDGEDGWIMNEGQCRGGIHRCACE